MTGRQLGIAITIWPLASAALYLLRWAGHRTLTTIRTRRTP